jgi:RHS repeat-associated protein
MRPSAVLWDRVQDPFGRQFALAASAGFDTPLHFPSQSHDPESGFAYNYFRDYDPSTGRYIESDPIGLAGEVNIYAYVGGNPLNANGQVQLSALSP